MEEDDDEGRGSEFVRLAPVQAVCGIFPRPLVGVHEQSHSQVEGGESEGLAGGAERRQCGTNDYLGVLH